MFDLKVLRDFQMKENDGEDEEERAENGRPKFIRERCLERFPTHGRTRTSCDKNDGGVKFISCGAEVTMTLITQTCESIIWQYVYFVPR